MPLLQRTAGLVNTHSLTSTPSGEHQAELQQELDIDNFSGVYVFVCMPSLNGILCLLLAVSPLLHICLEGLWHNVCLK